MSVRSACSSSAFKYCVFLLIFCLIDLSNVDSGVLKSLTIIIWESKSPCMSLRTCFMYLGAPVLAAYVLGLLALLVALTFFYYVMPFIVSFDLCWFKVYFIRDWYGNSCFFFSPLHFLGKSSSILLY